MWTAGNQRGETRLPALLLSGLLLWPVLSPAATTVRIESWRCAPGMLGRAGFEDADGALQRPSLGSGGEAELGQVLREIEVPGFGQRRFYLFVPPDYQPDARPVPLVVALHGQAGSSAGAVDQAAGYARDDWSFAARAHGFIVLAPAGHTVNGSWSLAQAPLTRDLLDAGIADVAARYNIDRNRVYGWGFSAGANAMHALALGEGGGRFAAYAVHAGSLRRGAGNGAPAAALRQVPVELWVGNGDGVYYPETLADHTLFANAGWLQGDTLQFTEFNFGHIYDSSHFNTIWPRWCPFAVLP